MCSSKTAALLSDIGATMVEYMLMIALLSLIAVAAVKFTGEGVCEVFDSDEIKNSFQP